VHYIYPLLFEKKFGLKHGLIESWLGKVWDKERRKRKKKKKKLRREKKHKKEYQSKGISIWTKTV